MSNVRLACAVSKTVGGGTPARDNPELWNGGIPWASVKDFRDGSYRLTATKEEISEKGLKLSASHLIPAGTPIVCTRMAVGRIAQAGRDVAINQDLRALFVNDNFDAGYLVLAVDSIRPLIENVSVGSTVKGINIAHLLDFEIFGPSKPEQVKVAEVLYTVEHAIEQTEALIAKQQRIKTGLMQDLLTRGMDGEGKLRSEKSHALKDTIAGRIPSDWDAVQIGSAVSLQRGHDITERELQPGPYPVISSSGIIGYHSEATSRGPNVVVGRKGTIGRVHYLEGDFWSHDTSLYATSFHGNHEKYFYYLFTHLDLARFGTKSGSPSLNRNDIHPLWIGLPTPEEQGKISNILSKCDQDLASLTFRLEKTKRLKIALMQDLLTGRTRVTALLDSKAKREKVYVGQ